MVTVSATSLEVEKHLVVNFATTVCVYPRFTYLGRTPTCDRQTDRRTDRQTHDYSIYRASIESHGKNGPRDSDHAN